jgi:hypothetical protein
VDFIRVPSPAASTSAAILVLLNSGKSLKGPFNECPVAGGG